MIRKWTPKQLDSRLAELTGFIANTVSPFGDIESFEEKGIRRTRAKSDKTFFKRTYFPHYAREDEPEYAPSIRRVAEVRCIPQLLLGFRGCGKSTDISLIDALHEILFQTAYFFVFVSRSTDIAVAEYAHAIRAELSSNPRIIHDFGNVNIEGTGCDFVANDVRVLCGGVRSSYRGKKHRGRRPDRIRIEDIEDNNNRMTPVSIKKYIRVLHDDILQSVGAGAGEEWSVIYIANYFSKRSLVHTVRISGLWHVTLIKALRMLHENEVHPDAVNGEVSTWRQRYPTKLLIEKRLQAPSTFRTEWQQEPDDDENAFRREWFQYYTTGSIPHGAVRYGWVDPSAGESGSADYKAYGVADFVVRDGTLWM